MRTKQRMERERSCRMGSRFAVIWQVEQKGVNGFSQGHFGCCVDKNLGQWWELMGTEIKKQPRSLLR